MDLFEYAISRQADPPTSHQAAVEVASKLSGLRAEFVARLRSLGCATANEVARGEESIRKRAKECQRLGLVSVVGERRCVVTGKNAMVYRVAK